MEGRGESIGGLLEFGGGGVGMLEERTEPGPVNEPAGDACGDAEDPEGEEEDFPAGEVPGA